MVVILDGSIHVRTLIRTLTMVSQSQEAVMYNVIVAAPDGVLVTVKPTEWRSVPTLKNSGVWRSTRPGLGGSNAKHRVRSPVAFTWLN